MKTFSLHYRLLPSLALAAVALFFAASLQAATIYKANNTTNLNIGSSWVGGVAPGSGDIAGWAGYTSTSANNTNTLGADLSWAGIKITTPPCPVTINSGNTLTLGLSGIDLSTATNGLTLNNAVTLGPVQQTWTVTNAQTLAVNGAVTRTAPATLNFAGGGTFTSSSLGNVNGIVGPWATYSATNYATVSGGNIVRFTTGTAAATPIALTDTTGTVNYDLAAAGAAPASVSANTIRYTGAAGTLNPGATSFAVNGLLNANGTLTVAGNTLTIGANKELVIAGSGAITIGSKVVDNGGGASGITVAGALALTNGANAFTGPVVYNSGQSTIWGATLGPVDPLATASSITVNSGATLVNNSGSGEKITPPLTLNGGKIRNFVASGSFYVMGPVTLNADSAFSFKFHSSSAAITVSNTITGNYGITLTDENSGAASPGSPMLRLAATNTYAGNTTINSGTLQMFGAASSLHNALPYGPGKGNVVLNGAANPTGTNVAGTLDLYGNDTAINGLVGTSNAVLGQVVNNHAGAHTLTVGYGDATSTFAGLLKDNTDGGGGVLNIAKTGAGTLTLSGANTYTGLTTVSNGTLLVNGSIPGNVLVKTGAVFGGLGSVGGTVTVQSSGIVQGGDAGYSNTLTTAILQLGVVSTDRSHSRFNIAAGGQIAATTQMVVNGTNFVDIVDSTLSVGTNTLFTYAGGSIFNTGGGVGGFAGFRLGTLPAGVTANLLDTGSAVQLAVTSVVTVNTNSPVLTNSISGNTLTLSWPADHLGWRLLAQTNSLTTGLGTNWFTWPNSTNVTSVPITINPADPAVFFRLVYP